MNIVEELLLSELDRLDKRREEIKDQLAKVQPAKKTIAARSGQLSKPKPIQPDSGIMIAHRNRIQRGQFTSALIDDIKAANLEGQGQTAVRSNEKMQELFPNAPSVKNNAASMRRRLLDSGKIVKDEDGSFWLVEIMDEKKNQN